MSTQTAFRPARSEAPVQAAPDFRSLIQTKGSGLPNRYITHAVEGWGKSSLVAQMPRVIVLQSRGETGLETLIDSGLLPETPHFPAAETWAEAKQMLNWLLDADRGYRTLGLDTLNGLERLCHEHVCARDFKNDWTDSGFEGYKRGYNVALADWRDLLNLLDRIRTERRMTIFALAHTKVTTFKNPEGADYDRYQAEMNAGTWSLTAKWADCVFFGNFLTATYAEKKNAKTGDKKGKAEGGNVRMLYTERHAAYDAKNRLGLPAELELPDNAADAWTTLRAAIQTGRATTDAAPAPAEKGAE